MDTITTGRVTIVNAHDPTVGNGIGQDYRIEIALSQLEFGKGWAWWFDLRNQRYACSRDHTTWEDAQQTAIKVIEALGLTIEDK